MQDGKKKLIDESNVKNLPTDVLFKVISRYSDIYINYMLKDTNLTRAQIPMLMKLLIDDNICQDELAKPLKLDRGAVTRTLSKLEDEGYITRTQDEENKRRNKISLTESGRKLATEMHNASKNRDKEILKDVPMEWSELNNILQKIAINSIKFNNQLIKDENNWEEK